MNKKRQTLKEYEENKGKQEKFSNLSDKQKNAISIIYGNIYIIKCQQFNLRKDCDYESLSDKQVKDVKMVTNISAIITQNILKTFNIDLDVDDIFQIVYETTANNTQPLELEFL